MKKSYEFTFHKAEVSGPLYMPPALELTVHYWQDFSKSEVTEEELSLAKQAMLNQVLGE